MTENNRKWYTVQTYSGYENKVKANLDQRIASMGMENKIFRVLVPTEERISVKDGKTRKVSHKLFPSYVLVEMIMDDQSWYVVRHTPGVSNFVGVGNRPLPVAPAEIDEILIKIGEKEAPAAPKVEITCSIGVASWHGAADSATQLLKRVDDALYTAKRTGRNRVCREPRSNMHWFKNIYSDDIGDENKE